ncbi:MAG: Type 1 glutamine amidotransferase-like domain-containing protein [Oscillospiraceae bacterium]|nr:Type 1 glutamine amidotransferase-like domain-containing protein [Oscillospiraceae bacterium]
MTLFVTSSPFVDGADRAILSNANGFIDRIRDALPPFPRCLFVCSDPEHRDMTCQFGADVFSAFADARIPFSSYAVLDAFNAEDAEALVADSDLIVLSGGHVPTQNAFFQETGLREILEGYPGVVVGISAGSMNCADVVYVQPEEEGESAPEFERFAPGLGLTEVNILPHYQKVKDNILDGLRLFEDITYADSMDNVFFALPDGSYFYQDDESLLLFGKAYRLSDGILEQLTEDDECLDMAELD